MSLEGITVTKPTTGDPFFIEDIRVYVPHREAVFIPADKVLASRDIHRAVNTKAVFVLMSTMPGLLLNSPSGKPTANLPSVEPKPSPDENGRLEALERENLVLRVRLSEVPKLQAIEEQMKTLLEAVGRIEAAGKQIIPIPAMTHNPAMGPVTEAVGGEVPMFIPDNLAPTDASVNVEVKQDTTGSGAISGAASKLRQLRKGK